MTKLALFDFANTLAELVPNRADIVRDYVALKSGILVEARDIRRAYQALDAHMPYSSVTNRSLVQKRSFYELYNRKLLEYLSLSHVVDSGGIYNAFESAQPHWRLKRGVVKILAELRSSGWRIGVISNFDDDLKELLYERLGLSQFVDYLHVSQIEGCEKPDADFYLSFFQAHKINIDDTIYVGDSYLLDFLPAKNLGLKVWLLDEDGFFCYLPESIRNIYELSGRLPIS